MGYCNEHFFREASDRYQTARSPVATGVFTPHPKLEEDSGAVFIF